MVPVLHFAVQFDARRIGRHQLAAGKQTIVSIQFAVANATVDEVFGRIQGGFGGQLV